MDVAKVVSPKVNSFVGAEVPSAFSPEDNKLS
jgi:hypothetical protein